MVSWSKHCMTFSESERSKGKFSSHWSLWRLWQLLLCTQDLTKKKKNLWNTLEISKQIHLSEQVPRRQLLAYSCRGLFLETEVSAAYPSYWKIPLSTGLIQNSFSELCFTSFPHSLLSPKLSHRILPEEQNTLIPCAAQHLDKKAISTQVACLLLSPEITPLPEEWGLAFLSLLWMPRLLSDSQLMGQICSWHC